MPLHRAGNARLGVQQRPLAGFPASYGYLAVYAHLGAHTALEPLEFICGGIVWICVEHMQVFPLW